MLMTFHSSKWAKTKTKWRLHMNHKITLLNQRNYKEQNNSYNHVRFINVVCSWQFITNCVFDKCLEMLKPVFSSFIMCWIGIERQIRACDKELTKELLVFMTDFGRPFLLSHFHSKRSPYQAHRIAYGLDSSKQTVNNKLRDAKLRPKSTQTHLRLSSNYHIP